MGIIRAFSGALTGTFADQWKEIVTAGNFDEHSLVIPGVIKRSNNGRGTNFYGSDGIISNGSKIYVPNNTAAFIFSESGIESVITQPGGYEYTNGQDSIFNKGGIKKSIFSQTKERIGYGGISANETRIAFVNLREIRNIRFGTRGPLIYNDLFYGLDLSVVAYGSYTIKIINPVAFVTKFVPPNTTRYSMDDAKVREQLTSEFLQSFIDAINTLSSKYRVSQLPSQANEVSQIVATDADGAGTWVNRFGFQIVKVSIESIQFTDDSKALVDKYNQEAMKFKVYDNVSQEKSNIMAQQKMAQGVETHGFGDLGGTFVGVGMAKDFMQQNVTSYQQNQPVQPVNSEAPLEEKKTMSIDEQIEALNKLKGLLDNNILTQEEFDIKKKEIMGF